MPRGLRSGSVLASGLTWFPKENIGIDEHDASQHKAGKGLET